MSVIADMFYCWLLDSYLDPLTSICSAEFIIKQKRQELFHCSFPLEMFLHILVEKKINSGLHAYAILSVYFSPMFEVAATDNEIT